MYGRKSKIFLTSVFFIQILIWLNRTADLTGLADDFDNVLIGKFCRDVSNILCNLTITSDYMELDVSQLMNMRPMFAIISLVSKLIWHLQFPTGTPFWAFSSAGQFGHMLNNFTKSNDSPSSDLIHSDRQGCPLCFAPASWTLRIYGRQAHWHPRAGRKRYELPELLRNLLKSKIWIIYRLWKPFLSYLVTRCKQN